MTGSIEEQAADWLLRLSEGEPSPEQLRQFEDWKRQDPLHAQAIERLQGFIGHMQSLRQHTGAARAALNAGRKRSPRRLPSAVLLLALAVSAALLLKANPPQLLLADLRTAPAEWRNSLLADGSQLILAGDSAVDIHFDAHVRRVELLHGEILVDVAKDAQRPFEVQTEHGRMRALGTRFLVRRETQSTVLSMLESRVEASAAQAGTTLEVNAGTLARITPEQVIVIGQDDPKSLDDAWSRHQLVVQDRPLAEVLAELQRQRRGFIRFDPDALGDLRISAVLPLDDSERALQLIAEALPVRVRHFGPWLVLVDSQP